ncbi:membrane protein [Nocardia seriolae]|uniref:Membrane protein n=1 Tax=Nocardia seriolae TaxID=37332 RepID=A0ABC9YX60_9NOCA|nr:hypothetical protein NS07_v2contig00055-0013 [Nocardia seriolae]GAP29543.1 membrane protein [Nocardia seriolae]
MASDPARCGQQRSFCSTFLVNVMPAFGPPTALVLVLFKLNWHLNPVVLVVAGALTSGCGRYLLATATGRIRARVSPHRQESLRAARDYLTSHKGRSLLGLSVFLLSPIPSAPLFEAAGLMGIRLLPITVAFIGGRLVSYSLYVGATSIAEKSLGAVFTDAVTSVYGIALQLILLLLVVPLARIDWTKLLPATPGDPGDGQHLPYGDIES